MRISRKKTKAVPKKFYFFNEGITASEVFVLDYEGQNLGAMKTAEAIRLAREQEMDLVLINPKSDPPVAKILNFGQYQYQQEKEARLKKAHQRITKTKCLRLSLRIGAHDLEIRKNKAVEFLNEGDKVKIEMILKGRERQQVPLAIEMIKKNIETINAEVPVRFDQNIEKQGNSVSAIIAKA